MDSGIIVALIMTAVIVGFILFIRLNSRDEGRAESDKPKDSERNPR